ncbi:MAG: hypothetical protein R3B82_00265 [Sandaracinaceae bacterium]
MPALVVLENEYLRAELLEERRVLILRRLPTPGPAAEVIGAYTAALADGRHFQGYSIVLDLREGPSRNDPEFEGSLGEMRRQLDRFFRRTVMLVGTAAGALQVRRLAREQGRDVLVANDEAEALRLCDEA